VYLIVAGSLHDYKLFKQLFDQKVPWFASASIFLDLGFHGANIILPHKKQKKSKKNPNPKLSQQQVRDNAKHKKFVFL